MKINGLPGEVGWKALVLWASGWELTSGYFFSEEEVRNYLGLSSILDKPYKWPVDVQADERVYCPTVEELCD